jgi:hypothetical protein
MKTDNKITNQDRREFIIKAFSSCTLCCLAMPNLVASDKESSSSDADDIHKFLKKSGMSHQAVFDFAFNNWYIPAMKNLKEQIGDARFLEMLKKSSKDLHESNDNEGIEYSERTINAFAENIMKTLEEDHWSNILSPTIIREDDEVFELKFSECLWAKTFREANASEIGYAGVCYQDYAMARSYNPKMSLIREKTLMQGHDCCHFKYTMEG